MDRLEREESLTILRRALEHATLRMKALYVVQMQTPLKHDFEQVTRLVRAQEEEVAHYRYIIDLLEAENGEEA